MKLGQFQAAALDVRSKQRNSGDNSGQVLQFLVVLAVGSTILLCFYPSVLNLYLLSVLESSLFFNWGSNGNKSKYKVPGNLFWRSSEAKENDRTGQRLRQRRRRHSGVNSLIDCKDCNTGLSGNIGWSAVMRVRQSQ